MIDLVQSTVARLQAEVPALRRVEGAAELAALVSAGQLPQQTPAAYVLPLGDDAEANRSATVGVNQRVTEQLGVVLIDRHAGSRHGEEARADLVPLIQACRAALIGWQPDGSYSALEYRRGRLVALVTGSVVYQLDFSTRWHLEDTP